MVVAVAVMWHNVGGGGGVVGGMVGVMWWQWGCGSGREGDKS